MPLISGSTLIAKTLFLRAAWVDRYAARARRAVVGERPGLVVPLFHSVAPSADVLHLDHVDPLYSVTLDQLTEALDYYVDAGFTPIGLPDLLAGLEPDRNYVMFTFDDGYANNLAAIDLLERRGVPALCSINTGFTHDGEAFWWDVLYREMTRAGGTANDIERERTRLTMMPPPMVRKELVSRYGETALRPLSDMDRPLSAAELRALARRPLVSLANHTTHHAVLVGLGANTAAEMLTDAQHDFVSFVDAAPVAVSYPYGLWNDQLIDCCRDLGFQVGFAGSGGKVRLPEGLEDRARMRIPRCVIYGDKPIAPQCESTHLDWKPSWTMRRWLGNLRDAATPVADESR